MGENRQDTSKKLHEMSGFLRHIWSRFRQDQCQDTAAALTYQTLFAVVPLLTVVYAAFSIIATFDMSEAYSGIQKQIEDFVFSHFIPQTGTVVQEYLSTFSDQARQLTSAGLLFLVVTAFLMLSTIEHAFNQIWKVDEPRKGLSKFLLYWAVLTLGPLLAIIGAVISTYVISLPLISDVVQSVGLIQFVPLLLSILVFTLIYAAVPNCKVPLRHAVFGGVVVALLFEIAKILFSWFFAKSSFELIYGAFASVPLFLLWIYLAWTLILGGAEIVRGLAVYDSDFTRAQEAPLFKILAVLHTFYCAHQRGEIISEAEIIKGGWHLGQENWNTYRRILLDLRLIKRLDNGDYILAKDLREITLWQLQRSLPWPLPERAMVLEENWQKYLSEKLQCISKDQDHQLAISLDNLFLKE